MSKTKDGVYTQKVYTAEKTHLIGWLSLASVAASTYQDQGKRVIKVKDVSEL